jgi:hypothetical protein
LLKGDIITLLPHAGGHIVADGLDDADYSSHIAELAHPWTFLAGSPSRISCPGRSRFFPDPRSRPLPFPTASAGVPPTHTRSKKEEALCVNG